MSNTLKLGNGKWATGKDTVLGYNSENNNIKPLPFSFSRDSSATVINKDGLIETVGSGEPRIDYKDDSKGALLLEPQRTNLIPYSEDFSNSVWLKSGVTITSGFTSPYGTNNAFKVLPNASGTNSYDVAVLDAISGLATSVKTNSFFVKPNGQRWLYLVPPSGGGNIVFFDLQNGVVGTEIGVSKGKIETYSDGWYRISLTEDANVGYCYFGIGFCDGDDSFTYTQSSNSIFLYGAQFELGSYATSYIPTSGGAVTRVVDVCNNGANEQVINSTEGVLYAEIQSLGGVQSAISISDGTYNNSISLGFYVNHIATRVRKGGSFILAGGFEDLTTNILNMNKVAISYNESYIKMFVNGVEIVNESGTLFSAGLFTDLTFTRGDSIYDKFVGNTKDVRIYNTALTDQELIALTTI